MKRVSGVLIAAALVLSLCLSAFAQSGETPIPFSLKDTNGKTVALSDYLGKDVVAIAFWATWCGSCLQELAFLSGMYEKYSERGFVVLAVNIDEEATPHYIKSFVEARGFEFPVLLDPEAKLLTRYQPSMITPFRVIINRAGKVYEKHEGFAASDGPSIEKTILQLLGESSGIGETEGAATGAAISLVETERAATGTAVTAAKPELQFNGELFSSVAYRRMMITVNTQGEKPPYIVNLRNYAVLDGRYGEWSAQMQANIVNFFEIEETLLPMPSDTLDLEKISVSYDHEKGWVSATAGDFRGVIANGLALSLRKQDLEGEDTTVRGARGKVSFPFGTRILALGGIVNPLPYVGVEDREKETFDSRLGGGAVEQEFPLELGTLGGFAFLSKFGVQDQDMCLGRGGEVSADYLWAGGYAEVLPSNKWVNFTAAGAWRKLRSERTCLNMEPLEEEEPGYGLFGDLTLNFGPVSIIAAGKLYDHYYVRDPVNAVPDSVNLVYPPKLEPELQEIRQNHDVWGFKTGLRAAVAKGLTGGFYFNRMVYTEFPDEHAVSYQGWSDWHYSGGSVLRYLHGEIGGRYESQVVTDRKHELSGKRFTYLISLDALLETTISVAELHELRPSFIYKRLKKLEEIQFTMGEEVDWKDELQFDLSYLYTSRYGVAVLYGYSTRNAGAGPHFIAGALIVNPYRYFNMRLLGGTMYGGVRCLAGVCRTMPDFEGVRLDIITRF